jgi:hypothetical protein
MRVEEVAIGGLAPKTVLAMNRVGGIILSAIESHQQLLIKHPKVGQQALLFEALKDLEIHPIEVTRHERIEQVSHLIVTGNLLHTKQGTGIIVALGVLEMTLVIQKRWRLGVKDAKGAQNSVLDGVSGVWPWFAMVGQLLDPSVQNALERIEV